tara:strand:+ start:4344 stop:4565 length:222 start_codon:yes stop_codon:yes gene_type:complete
MDNTTLKEGFLGQKMIALPKSIISVIRANPITRNFYISDLGYYPMANHHYRLRKKVPINIFLFTAPKEKGKYT